MQVSSVIPYQSDGVADGTVREECDWNTTMPRYLAEESDGRVIVAENKSNTNTGKRLVLVATNFAHLAVEAGRDRSGWCWKGSNAW